MLVVHFRENGPFPVLPEEKPGSSTSRARSEYEMSPVYSGSGHRARIRKTMKAAIMVALVGALAAPTAISAVRPAPRLEGVDARSGRHLSLADYAGKRVVINVWGSWCIECVVESADLKRFASTHRDVQLLGIDIHDTRAHAKQFYKQYDEDWPSIFDPSGKIAKRLGASTAPVTFFLDRRHRIVAVVRGQGTLADFNAAYRKTLRR
jgi:peroxiredoxin